MSTTAVAISPSKNLTGPCWAIRRKVTWWLLKNSSGNSFDCSIFLTLPQGLLSLDDAEPEEKKEIPQHPAIPSDMQEELTKAGFPEVEGDLAPSAMVPKACGCIQKHISKIDALYASLSAVEQPSPLQTRMLVMFFWWGGFQEAGLRKNSSLNPGQSLFWEKSELM